MRIEVDDRARIPFALVAIVLLVGSATLAASVRGRHPGGADPDAAPAIERTASATRTVVAQAVDAAARRAARGPVIAPANTTYGRVINGSSAFRDYLRIRIYLRAVRRLERIHQRAGAVRTSASIPAVDSPADLRRAKRRVRLVTNGSTLQVRIRNVTFTAVRNGRVIRRERRPVSVAVDNPVLVLHGRTRAFERRLNAGATHPGLTQRLTARMYAVAYARGYAYRGGAPIENVVANRHVELMTNGAIVRIQRQVFGTSDESARSVMNAAMVQVALRDLAAPVVAGATDRQWWVSFVTGRRPPPQESIVPYRGLTTDGPGPEKTVTVGVNGTADVAFGALFGTDRPSFDAILNRTYSADAKVVTAVRKAEVTAPPPPDPPGKNWTLVRTERRIDGRTAVAGAGPRPSVPDGWSGHALYTRRVVERHVIVRHWRRDGNTTTTSGEYETVYRVGVRVVDDHAPSRFAPDAPIDVVHERGGPLNGPNLRAVPHVTRRRLVTDRGGPDALARRAVAGTLNRSPVRIPGARPADLRPWIHRDLASLRERVRNLSVELPRGKLATSANAPARLVATIRSRRERLVDAPDTYRSVADKVRVAARAAYLDRVVARLRADAEDVERAQAGIGDALSKHGSSRAEADRAMDHRKSPDRIRARPEGRPRMTVDAAPSYLPLAPVDHATVPAVDRGTTFHALVAENVNLFTVPYADAGKAVVDELGKRTDTAGFGTAARTLRAATGTLSTANGSATLRRRRAVLRSRVSASLAGLLNASADQVGNATDLSGPTAVAAVRAGLDRWNTTSARAIALLNGSAVVPIVAAVDRRANLSALERDLLATRLRVTVSRVAASDGLRVSAAVVRRASNATRATLDREATRAASKRAAQLLESGSNRAAQWIEDRYGDRIQRALRRRASKLFPKGKAALAQSGLPLLPSPTSWYATVNLWVVNVGGTYARFTVRDGPVAYTRDGDPVAVDVDGDGDEDRLGTASRVSFESSTVVAVAVPPGPRGVGDTNGDALERSRGWCTPGPADAGTNASC